MDFLEAIYTISAVVALLMGLFGWNYSTLYKKVEKLNVQMAAAKTDADLRILISDKLEPYAIRLENMSKEIINISYQYAELDRKLDSLISLIKH